MRVSVLSILVIAATTPAFAAGKPFVHIPPAVAKYIAFPKATANVIDGVHSYPSGCCRTGQSSFVYSWTTPSRLTPAQRQAMEVSYRYDVPACKNWAKGIRGEWHGNAKSCLDAKLSKLGLSFVEAVDVADTVR